MAEFTVIPDANLEPEKPGRSIDALALRDNPIAIAEGAAGAPRIQTAAIQDGAVAQAKLKTNTTSLSGTIGGFGRTNLSLGPYAFFPSIEGGLNINVVASTTSGSADAPRIGLRNDGESSNAYTLRWRRIIA